MNHCLAHQQASSVFHIHTYIHAHTNRYTVSQINCTVTDCNSIYVFWPTIYVFTNNKCSHKGRRLKLDHVIYNIGKLVTCYMQKANSTWPATSGLDRCHQQTLLWSMAVALNSLHVLMHHFIKFHKCCSCCSFQLVKCVITKWLQSATASVVPYQIQSQTEYHQCGNCDSWLVSIMPRMHRRRPEDVLIMWHCWGIDKYTGLEYFQPQQQEVD